MREIRVHGQSQRYLHTRVGVGGRMDTLQCAIVLGKLERFEWEIEERKRIGDRYAELIRASGRSGGAVAGRARPRLRVGAVHRQGRQPSGCDRRPQGTASHRRPLSAPAASTAGLCSRLRCLTDFRSATLRRIV